MHAFAYWMIFLCSFYFFPFFAVCFRFSETVVIYLQTFTHVLDMEKNCKKTQQHSIKFDSILHLPAYTQQNWQLILNVLAFAYMKIAFLLLGGGFTVHSLIFFKGRTSRNYLDIYLSWNEFEKLS